MKHQKQPNGWSCLPTAFAIVANIDVDLLYKMIGHDGSSIIWPDQREPYCRRAFHVQEVIYAFWEIGLSVTCFSARPTIENDYEIVYPFDKVLYANEGVLTGRVNNQEHAVAWDRSLVIDPNGTFYPVDRFEIRDLWIIKST